jgi:HAD superfamily hydrolase (TIGR01484 family)
MMFASDLDRTLIFSNKAMEEFPFEHKEELITVERKQDENLAFMTLKSFELLKRISEKLLFVPVTTRSVEQFKRVFIFQDSISSKYAVTSNGACIFYNGKQYSEWTNNIHRHLTHECIDKREVIKTLQKDFFHIPGEMRVVENLFIYYLLSSKLDEEILTELKKYTEPHGWKLSYQGRKLYLMPNPVSKGKAIKYIQEQEGISTLYGAGDSLLDHDFLELCHHRFLPSHGELMKLQIDQEKYTITKNKGAKAGEELLHSLMNLLES